MALATKNKSNVHRKAYRGVLAGVGGIGKTTAIGTIAKNALIIDLDKRFPKRLIDRNNFGEFQETFKGVKAYLNSIVEEPTLEYDLIALDTCTKLLSLIEAWTIQQDCKGSKEVYAAYGHGLKFAHQYFQEILDIVDRIQDKHGVNFIFVCHTKLKSFKSSMGDDYIKNQLDLPDVVADRLRQWADASGFVYYDTQVDEKKRVTATPKRIITFQDAPQHDAKNGMPWGLPEKMDFDIDGKWASIAFRGYTEENKPEVQAIDTMIQGLPIEKRSQVQDKFDTINYRTLDSKTLKTYIEAAKQQGVKNG